MKKSDIRIFYKSQRIALADDLKRDWAYRMKKYLIDFLQGKSINVVMSFEPMRHLGEIDTAILEQGIVALFPHVKIVYPRIQADSMIAVLPTDKSNWTVNEIGVKEYDNYQIISPSAIDLVLVPLLIVDMEGFRVGYGKGFYDRFLKQIPAITIGLSFFEPITKIEDVNAFDIPLQYCISPSKIYVF